MKRKKLRPLPANLVPHPRYGLEAYHARVGRPASSPREAFERFGRPEVFPESRLAADRAGWPEWQRPHAFYEDVLKTCERCRRPFIFFAREQKHWVEVLGFHRWSDARECVGCRRLARVERAVLARYVAGARAGRQADPATLLALVDDATRLVDAGVLKRVERLGALKNRALRACGENARIAWLEQAIGRLRQDSSMTSPPTAREAAR